MRAVVYLAVELEYDSSVLEGEVDQYAYELMGTLASNFPTPPAGVTVEQVRFDSNGVVVFD
jgi:hypothetical protein